MKLLLDQGLPRSAAALLSEAGLDTVHVGDIGYSSATDDVLLELGRSSGRVVVTLDADFHTLLALAGSSTPSVIRIRMEGLRGQALAELLQRVLAVCESDLEQGAAVSVQRSRLRIRRLPIGRDQREGDV